MLNAQAVTPANVRIAEFMLKALSVPTSGSRDRVDCETLATLDFVSISFSFKSIEEVLFYLALALSEISLKSAAILFASGLRSANENSLHK